MSVEELDGSRVQHVLDTESRGVLIDFWSPWCAPCRVLRPHLRRLADEHADDWRVVAVNTEAHPEAAERFSVSSLPTLVWFRGGQELNRISGPTTVSSVAEQIEQLAL